MAPADTHFAPADRPAVARARAPSRIPGVLEHISLPVMAVTYVCGMVAMMQAKPATLTVYTILFIESVVLFLRYAAGSTGYRHPFVLLVPLVLIEQVCAPIAMLGLERYSPGWLASISYPEEFVFAAMVITAVGMAALIAGEWLTSLLLSARAEPVPELPRSDIPDKRLKQAVWLFMGASVLCSAVRIHLGGGLMAAFDPTRFSQRRILTKGLGYLEILAIAGYVAVILEGFRTFRRGENSWKDWARLVLLAGVAGVPGFLLGQRSRSLLPLGLLVLTRLSLPDVRTRLFRAAPVLAALIVAFSVVSLRVRQAVFAHGDPGAIFRIETYRQGRLVPMSFGHLELLGATIASKRASLELQNTLLSSLFAWRPRRFFPEKGPTTGLVLAAEFGGWVDRYGEPTGSYTTGVILELHHNGGMVFVIVGMLALGSLSAGLSWWNRIRPPGAISNLVFVFQAYLLGWNLWFDDLGGAATKQFIFLVLLCGLYVIVRWGRRVGGVARV